MPHSRSILAKVRRLGALSGMERRLFLRALPIVAIVRLGLWLLHPSYVMRRVEKSVERRRQHVASGPARPREVARAVKVAARRVPAASCLVQALAARLMLAEQGCDSVLRIGVARQEGGDIEAHAWVEVDGIPVIGGREFGRYTVFSKLDVALPGAPRPLKSRRSLVQSPYGFSKGVQG